VEATEDSDYNGNDFVCYRMLEEGENWFLENQEQLELRVTPKASRQPNSTLDDDIPF